MVCKLACIAGEFWAGKSCFFMLGLGTILSQYAISKFQKLPLSKRLKVQNLSCENEFYLHDT